MRPPVVNPEGETLEEGEILTRLADKLGLLPNIPETLYQAASGDRMNYGSQLMAFAQSEPRAMKFMPFILAKTLGKALGSTHLAALWGMLQVTPQSFRDNAVRAGFSPGFGMGEEIYKAILEHPEGILIGKSDTENHFNELQTEDKRINVFIPELEAELKSITAEKEEAALRMNEDYPLILAAGRHMDYNANTIMRDPAWNEGNEHAH